MTILNVPYYYMQVSLTYLIYHKNYIKSIYFYNVLNILKDLLNEKIALFIKVDSYVFKMCNKLLIHQFCDTCEIFNNQNKVNIILPNFDMMYSIFDCPKIINDAKKMNITFTITISSYTNLKNCMG